ncbi:EAL domain-containing protein [Lacrimispora sp. NSJ-141]|uniref:EAL domain-containing protein n=1 Tax=Lientehia hominis TaxID=2897778 RepID=A0AAP2RL16_9FIRM|nr:EAL domain-containing protein [Lientehia hominis]MCD2493623.1 EAL domain-containing protein [Lientehia hominis]
MDRQPGKNETTCITVIDDDYRILYVNERMQALFQELKAGDICYEAVQGEDGPCACCPLKQNDKDSVVVYNRHLGQWLEFSSGRAEWPGHGSCTIIFSKSIGESNKNLLYDLTQMPAYDELFELNISRNTYKILFHAEGKYVVPPVDGRLDEMRSDVAEHMIHPDDKERFLEFWDFDKMLEGMGKGGELLEGKFRKKLAGGGYCWVLQIAVPLRYNENHEKIIICFIQDIHEQAEEAGTRKQKELDDGADALTGLYRAEVFFEKAAGLLKENSGRPYCLVAIDIEHFKLFNEWYGLEEGDRFLVSVAGKLNQIQEEYPSIAGYMGGDDFVILLPLNTDIIVRLEGELTEYVRRFGGNAGFLPAFGIYPVESPEESMRTMYDRAAIAMSSVKGNYAKRTAWYDFEMKRRLEEDQLLLSEVQKALENQEFVLYVQPRCNMITGKIVGLESLVRWEHPEKGNIMPGTFIPLLEQNGFITNLDLYAWELVCRKVSSWIKEGFRPVPVSVNVSRIDIYAVDVVKVFKELIKKFELDSRLIEIEITESAYVQDYEVIKEVVERLRVNGFTVLMDDFGSGYSSLNMLKDVNVDILKLDMKFLDMEEESRSRGMDILEAIVKLANLMKLRLIAEGIETKEQKDFLMDIGCFYAQGYYFCRPLPMEEADILLSDEENIDFRGIMAEHMENLSLKDLFTGDLSSAMLNNMLGGVAFYDLYGGCLELLQVNEQYYRVTGCNPVDLEEKRRQILSLIEEEDRKRTLDIFRSAVAEPINGAEGEIRRRRLDGTVMWMHIHVFFLREHDGHRLFYGAVNDVTEQRRRELLLRETNKTLLRKNNELKFLNNDTPGGYYQCIGAEDLELVHVSNRFMEILGYSKNELTEDFENSFLKLVHPEDRKWVSGMFRGLGMEEIGSMECRMEAKNGSIWTLIQGRKMEQRGKAVFYGVILDISENMALVTSLKGREKELWLTGKKMESIIRQAELNVWNWDIDTSVLTISGPFGDGVLFHPEERGEDGQVVYAGYPEMVKESDMVLPVHRKELEEFYRKIARGENAECELQVEALDGRRRWLRTSCETICDESGKPVNAVGYFTDITGEKEEELQTMANMKALEILQRQAVYSLRINLSRDEILDDSDKSIWLDSIGGFSDLSYTEAYNLSVDRNTVPQYADILRRFMDRDHLLGCYDRGVVSDSVEYVRMLNGKPKWMRLLYHLVRFDETMDIIAYVFVLDIHEQKLCELELVEKAVRDSLTGLYNRRGAIPLIHSYLDERQEETAAFIIFDLDNFKQVNDVFGHMYGDTVIADNAGRLKDFFRKNDVICRLGGDEFMVLCKNISETDTMARLEQIVQETKRVLRNEGREIVFSFSAGFVMIPEQGTEFDDLYKKADIALFQAKAAGKGRYKKYEPGMKEIRPELAEGR